MHIGNMDKGMVAAIAIVGGSVPLAAGMALAFKMRKTSQVVACFFGDGATSEGAFYEGINLAAIWDLPAIFVCEKGTLFVDRNRFTADPPELAKNPPEPQRAEKWEGPGWQAKYHIGDWLECIKTRKRPFADVEIGHRSISLCHLANIAREVGRRLRWDPKWEVFVGDEEANRLLDRPRRKGYELPKPT